jgi:tetratricopeptide (TPR) repeat protein
VHAAHRVRGEFPDGQLFLDLHGYSTGLDALTAGDALDWFLRSLGVPPQLIPQDLGERAAFFRERLEGTKTLIVLDNASSTAQIRPLLPNSPGCLVLVTSRRRLAGLDDARSLALDVLSQNDSVALLHKVAGPGRIAAHHPAILELIELCGRMPLAIRVIAARLRHHRVLRIEEVVAQLRDDNARLQHLQDEDRNLTAVFDLSYQDLAEAEQHLFRLLGLVPGPDVDAYAVASLTGADHRTAERLLESLLDHNLLTQHTPERYRFHDLVRVYARTLTDQDRVEDREAAFDRLLDYYTYTARAADRYLARNPRSGPPAGAAPPATAPDLADRAAALAWLRAERSNLLAAVTQAAARARQPSAVALTAALAAFLQSEGPWPQAATLHLAAAALAHEYGDSSAEAYASSDLGRIRMTTGDNTAAIGLHERALAIFRRLGDGRGEANALWELGRASYLTGDHPGAEGLLGQGLAIFQNLGDRQGQGNCLRELGHVRYLSGDFPAAQDLFERALAIFWELDDRFGAANTLWELGRVRLLIGDYPAAGEMMEQALVIYQDFGSRHGEANALSDLGQVRWVTGNYPAAAALQEQALAIFQDLGHRHGEAYALWDLGRVRYRTGNHLAAADLLEQALAIFRHVGHRHGQANALHYLGRVRQATGDHPAAADLLEQALAIFQDVGDPQSQAEVLNSTGALTAETSGPQAAVPVYRRALKLAREVRSPLDEALALDGAARCAARIGDRTAALTGLREAVALYRRLGAAEAAEAGAFLTVLESGVRPETGN